MKGHPGFSGVPKRIPPAPQRQARLNPESLCPHGSGLELADKLALRDLKNGKDKGATIHLQGAATGRQTDRQHVDGLRLHTHFGAAGREVGRGGVPTEVKDAGWIVSRAGTGHLLSNCPQPFQRLSKTLFPCIKSLFYRDT